MVPEFHNMLRNSLHNTVIKRRSAACGAYPGPGLRLPNPQYLPLLRGWHLWRGPPVGGWQPLWRS